MTNPSPPALDPRRRLIWRWHFYAGLFCMPFVLWLASTGSIYLFKPQIDAWLERSYDHLRLDGPRAAPSAQVAAALASEPGSVLNAYELPRTPRAAVRVLVGHGSTVTRVYVDPQTLQVLGHVEEERRFTRLIFRLHGELLLGRGGSMLVELAASWAIVMLISGLYLWWPRDAQGLAGVAWPRLRRGGRVFWRDLHAVVGVWVSAFALFLLVSGLPWATFWGGNLKTVRSLLAPAPAQQDWTTGSADEAARNRARNTRRDEPGVDLSGHAGHEMRMHAVRGAHDIPGMIGMSATMRPGFDAAALDRLVPVVAARQLPPPVLIAPPSAAATHWTARSDTQNRPRRVELVLDGDSGTLLQRTAFGQRALLDRIIGTGVAAHEGQLFGWLNQLLGLLTALGLITLCLSALTMWWQRRPHGKLGAPAVVGDAGPGAGLIVLVLLFSLLLPLLGASLIAVLFGERLLLRRIAPLRNFLGLAR
ncbi:PepSY-associated TM helix domain-containing protein [Solimonas terrae]|uniref:PepSY domain-containing protein n=1 Tax=Solimonas terrae TaxID=1396819 RepID=A0A6M2BTL7_9GAMM|nr:PepSY domain-containing protein [Solimonas terrae]NGY05551.1 PepSY domain-containing protein [Solimonas terrae]